MQAVSAALDLLFTDPNLALDAWHRDVAGQFTKLRIIPRALLHNSIRRGFTS